MRRLSTLVTIVLPSLTASATSVFAQWEVVGFGSPSAFSQGVCLGRGIDGDSIRIYVASGWNGDGKGYQWTYAGGSWTGEEVYSGVGIGYSPVVGAVGGSDERRLYVGSYSQERAYEVFREGGIWRKNVVPGSEIASVVCVRAGQGRNDGVSRLYISHADAGVEGGLYELSYDAAGARWDVLRVHTRDVGEFAIADGRNDGVQRIYAGSREGGDGGLMEFTWDGSGFVASVIRTPGYLQNRIQTTYVGDGRGDGRRRVFVNEWAGRLLELTYQEGAWSVVQVAGSATRFYLTSGRLRPDGQRRLYASLQGRGVYEHMWTGSKYEASVDAVTAATGQIAIGNGRNDGKSRMYVGRGDRSPFSGSVAEVSHADPPDAEPSGGGFRRGDANADGEIDVGDPIRVLIHLFVGGTRPLDCEEAADADDSGSLEVTDAVHLLVFLFLAGTAPPAPHPACGEDPTADTLTCVDYAPCGEP